EKIKDIEMPDFGVGKQLSFAGVGGYKEGNSLGDLFSIKKEEPIGPVRTDKDVDGKGESGSKVETVGGGGTDAIQIGKTDLDALRNKLGVPETDTKITNGNVSHKMRSNNDRILRQAFCPLPLLRPSVSTAKTAGISGGFSFLSRLRHAAWTSNTQMERSSVASPRWAAVSRIR
ncbi:MAG: hypothetical protein II328_05255, partial [Clostridia bacterium]|nr:hypothetical protein [Clostridia bacterium]